jgi:hypothetical protein
MATKPNTELRRIAAACLPALIEIHKDWIVQKGTEVTLADLAIRYAKELQKQLNIEAPVGGGTDN